MPLKQHDFSCKTSIFKADNFLLLITLSSGKQIEMWESNELN